MVMKTQFKGIGKVEEGCRCFHWKKWVVFP
jgi:hypothetical protein